MYIRTLEYVIAVAELGHFSKAAERCHVSQSTLSLQIRSLEEQLGVELFERSAHPVKLTPVGEQLIALMRLTTRSSHDLQGLAKSLRAPASAARGGRLA